MKLLRGTLSTALFASGLVGIQILATDDWLWYSAPTHAYGLVGFVAIDLFLVAWMWRKTRLAALGAMATGTVQLITMFGDLVVGQPEGTPSSAFKTYLLANNAFLTLLAIQGVILALSIGGFVIPLMQHHRLMMLPIRQHRD